MSIVRFTMPPIGPVSIEASIFQEPIARTPGWPTATGLKRPQAKPDEQVVGLSALFPLICVATNRAICGTAPG